MYCKNSQRVPCDCVTRPVLYQRVWKISPRRTAAGKDNIGASCQSCLLHTSALGANELAIRPDVKFKGNVAARCYHVTVCMKCKNSF